MPPATITLREDDDSLSNDLRSDTIERCRSPGFSLNARSSADATPCGTSGRTRRSGGESVDGGSSPVSAAKQVAASCHWSLAGVGAQPLTVHSGAVGVQRPSGATPVGRSAREEDRVLLAEGAPGFEHSFLKRAWACGI